MPDINTRTVMRAVWDLHGHGAWPTVAKISAYLEAPESDVRPLLTQLKARRIFKDRRRNNETVWGPWDPAEFER